MLLLERYPSLQWKNDNNSKRRRRRPVAVKQQMISEFDRIEQKLGIQKPEDWITVSLAEAHEMGLPKKFVKNTTELVEWLQERYPTQQWEKMFISKGKFGQQRRFEQAVSNLFPVPLILQMLLFSDTFSIIIGNRNGFKREECSRNDKPCNRVSFRTRCVSSNTQLGL